MRIQPLTYNQPLVLHQQKNEVEIDSNELDFTGIQWSSSPPTHNLNVDKWMKLFSIYACHSIVGKYYKVVSCPHQSYKRSDVTLILYVKKFNLEDHS